MADLQARTRSLDPARQAYAQARAGLPVTVCPFCGGPPNYAAYHRGQGDVEIPLCCCVKCYDPATCVPGGDPDRRCLECPHRPAGEP